MVKLKYKLLLAWLTVPCFLNAQNQVSTVPNNFSASEGIRYSSHWQIEKSENKNAGGVVFLKSLLLPGWGQQQLAAKKAKRNFILSEALLLGSTIGFRVYRNWLQDDYIAFAASHAGVDPAGKDAVFWADIGDYLSIYEYNDSWLRRRSLTNLRDPAGGEFWQWDALHNAQKYRDMRISADRAKTWSQFAIAGLITNHVVSALHALWLHRKQVKLAANDRQYFIAFQPAIGQKGGRIKLTLSF